MGLIGKDPTPLFFKTRFGIHTFGVITPIDVLILDKNYKVVKIKALLPLGLFILTGVAGLIFAAHILA